jgi:crotonobetainyl-CoA:carnitine CoA-transferase CaiB-like acyl-CoA transferase
MSDAARSLLGRTPTGPLAGIVIADFARILAGPYATMLLADLGALVIKVEGPGGDDTRGWSPPRRAQTSTYFLSINRNKFSIALDLANDGDLAIAHRIAGRADVFIENFKPGGLTTFGLDYPALAADHPRLVYASITGFGTGAGANLPGYDLVAQAVSGLMDLTGDPGSQPTKAGVALIDVITGLHAATGILAALHERDRSGLGQHVEVSLLMSALSGLVNQSGAYAAAGAVPTRMGNDHPSLFPYGPFPARDKNIIIAVGNDSQFAAVCRCLHLPELASDARFATMAARNEHRAQLRELLSAQLVHRDAQEWYSILTNAGVPAAPILNVAEGAAFAGELGLEPIVTAGSCASGVPTIRNPIGLSRSAADYGVAPTALDEDRDAILTWLDATAQ